MMIVEDGNYDYTHALFCDWGKKKEEEILESHNHSNPKKL